MFQFMFMVQLLVKFKFFIQELWERKSLQIFYEYWRWAYHALLAQLFIKTTFHLNTLLFIFFHSLIQFFLRLGCKKITPNLSTFPVYLQYSNNGGISWTTIEQFDFNKYSIKPTYIALHLPENARTNSTRIRWWQPSVDGTFLEDWAIDHVCWIQPNLVIMNCDNSFSEISLK